MSYIEDIQNRRNQVRNNIAKGFGCEFVKAEDDELGEFEKAIYADTPQNRKLGRVGQEYHRGKGKKDENKNGEKINRNDKTAEKKQKRSKAFSVKDAAKEFDKTIETTNNWDDDDWMDAKKNDKLIKDLKAIVKKYNLSKEEFKSAWGHHAYGLDISYDDLK